METNETSLSTYSPTAPHPENLSRGKTIGLPEGKIDKYSQTQGRKDFKCLPAMREIWVQSLGREDPLEKEMATHSSTVAWKIPQTEVPGRLQSMGSQRVDQD